MVTNVEHELEALRHDLKRQMTIANIECNEAENLRRILRVARPYISDRAGIGILSAIDEALSGDATVHN